MASLASRLSACMLAAALAGCGEQVEIVDLGLVGEGPQAPALAMPASGEPKPVVVPESLQGRFSQVTIAVQLPGVAALTPLELPLDGESHQTAYGHIAVRDYLPAFRMRDDSITSDGAEATNPALWAEWRRDGELIFSGWLFRDYPSMSPVKRPGHRIALIEAR